MGWARAGPGCSPIAAKQMPRSMRVARTCFTMEPEIWVWLASMVAAPVCRLDAASLSKVGNRGASARRQRLAGPLLDHSGELAERLPAGAHVSSRPPARRDKWSRFSFLRVPFRTLQSPLAVQATTCRSSECIARQSLRAGGGYCLLISRLKVRFLRGAPTWLRALPAAVFRHEPPPGC